MITVSRTALVLIEGDSTADGVSGYSIAAGVQREIGSRFMSSSGGSYRRPAWRNQAISGSVWADVASRIAAELAANPYTHAIIACGVNDANNAVTLNQSRTDAATIRDALITAGVQAVIIGACCIGEKFPTGQNNATKDAALEALDNASTGVAPIFTDAGFTYVSTRNATTGLYALEATLNTPLPGATVGPGTRPDATAIHENPFFASKLTELLMAQISFS